MDRFLCTVSVFYLCKTGTPIFSSEKKEKELDYKKNFHFKKKVVHFLRFKSFFFQSSNLCDAMLFKPFTRCFFPNKSYFNWCLQSYTNPSVYFSSCNFATCIQSGLGNSKHFLPPVNCGKKLNLELSFETQSHM